MNLPGKTKQRTSIEQIRENDFEAISEYYTTGSSTALTEQQQRILERLRTAHAVMRKYPRKSVAALKLQARFPEISREQAYCDIRNACRLWNKYDPVSEVGSCGSGCKNTKKKQHTGSGVLCVHTQGTVFCVMPPCAPKKETEAADFRFLFSSLKKDQ